MVVVVVVVMGAAAAIIPYKLAKKLAECIVSRGGGGVVGDLEMVGGG